MLIETVLIETVLIGNLRSAEVGRLVDVRSEPYSRWRRSSPQELGPDLL